LNPAGDHHILKALKAADDLCCLADEGEQHSQDDGCCVLYGIVRDCAYKIRSRARQEQEKHAHIRRTRPQNEPGT
jgi:hypothetical protein